MERTFWFSRTASAGVAVAMLASMLATTLGGVSAGAAQQPPAVAPVEPTPIAPPVEGAPPAEPTPEPPPELVPAPEPVPAPTPVPEPVAEPTAPAPGEVSLEAELPPVEAPIEEPEPAAGTEEEMVVTGSRIRRTSFSQPSAVQLMDRKQLALSGADNMADVVKNMTINSGSDFNTDVSTGAGGTAQFNLRGLGLSSTLVLLNGRRLVQSGALATDGSNFVDINTIPISAIERIEILKGGASAIYGSDAVAGVVNIITRKNYDGFEVQLGGQATDKFDQGEWDVALTGGTSNDTTRLMGTVTFFDRKPLKANERDFTENGRNTSLVGWPSSYVLLDPATGAPTAVMRDPGCDMVPRATPFDDPNAGDRPYCTFDFNDYFHIVPKEQRVNVMTTVEHDIGDHVTAFVEAAYARARTERGLSPSFPLLKPVIVPADHQYNPYGVPARWLGRPLGGDSEGATQFYNSDTLHTATGLKGDFAGLSEDKLGEWEWQLAGTWSTNQFVFGLPDARQDVLQGALNSCSPGTNPANCWNPFYAGPRNSAALIDKVIGELAVDTNVELSTVGVDFSGPLFELPGGDLSLALGGQVRHETAVVNLDDDANAEGFNFLIGGPDWEAERDILAAYGELSLPFAEGLEVQAAGRLEDYDDVGSTIDPMLGVSWTPAVTFQGRDASPASKVRVRGTYATSFRAPSLLQAHGAQTELLPVFNVTPNMDGEPVTAATATYVAARTQGNADLDPQKATAITAGLEWSPVTGLFLQADYWNYDYEEIIVKENAQQKVDLDFDDKNDPDVHYGVGGNIEQVDISFINAPSVMTHGVDLDVSYSSDFDADAGRFSFGAGGSYVLAYEIPEDQIGPTVRNADVVDCSGGECDVAGVRNSANFARPLPRLRLNVPLSWTLEGHTAGIAVHFISGYKDDFDADANPMVEDFQDIDAWTTLDLQYGYRIDEGEGMSTTIKVGCNNVLGSEPPAVDTGFGYDVLTHDARGRLLYARLIQEF
jgi:iron complex outermembrane receptor protein